MDFRRAAAKAQDARDAEQAREAEQRALAASRAPPWAPRRGILQLAEALEGTNERSDGSGGDGHSVGVESKTKRPQKKKKKQKQQKKGKAATLEQDGAAGREDKTKRKRRSNVLVEQNTGEELVGRKDLAILGAKKVEGSGRDGLASSVPMAPSFTMNKSRGREGQVNQDLKPAGKRRSLPEGVRKLVDEVTFTIPSNVRKESPLAMSENQYYSTIGVLGEQRAGKSYLLNRFCTSNFTENPVDLNWDEHETAGVQICTALFAGQRTIAIDCQPVLSSSVMLHLLETSPELGTSQNMQELATLRDLHLAIFMLSVCDCILVVEDDNLDCTRGLWKLLRYAYILKGGDVLSEPVADCVLVRNKMVDERLFSRKVLESLQRDWMDYFDDIVPYAAAGPKFYFAPVGMDPTSMSAEIMYLKRVVMFLAFTEPRHPELVPSVWRNLCNNTGWEVGNESKNVEAFHLFKLLQQFVEHRKSRQVKLEKNKRHDEQDGNKFQNSKRTSQRLTERAFLEFMIHTWSRGIPHSVQLREFAANAEGLLV